MASEYITFKIFFAKIKDYDHNNKLTNIFLELITYLAPTLSLVLLLKLVLL